MLLNILDDINNIQNTGKAKNNSYLHCQFLLLLVLFRAQPSEWCHNFKIEVMTIFFVFFFVLWNASDFLLVGFHFSIFMSDVNVHEKGDCWKKQLIFNKLLQVSCLHEIQRLYAYLSLGSLKVVLLTQKFRNFSMNFIVMLWTSQP